MILSSLVLVRTEVREALGTEESGWIRRSQVDVPEILESPFLGGVPSWWLQPYLWAGVVIEMSLLSVFYFSW